MERRSFLGSLFGFLAIPFVKFSPKQKLPECKFVDSYDLITFSYTSRKSRYKAYERLRNDPTVETALQALADEACKKWNTSRGLHIFEIGSPDKHVKDELDFFFFETIPNIDVLFRFLVMDVATYGDSFIELIKDSGGVLRLQMLPADSVYRIETTKGKLIEFQQSNSGPDYQALTKSIDDAVDYEKQFAIRFKPEQIIHIKIGPSRKTFYPYGESVLNHNFSQRLESVAQDIQKEVLQSLVQAADRHLELRGIKNASYSFHLKNGYFYTSNDLRKI